MPFTPEQFFKVFENYNQSIFPMQTILFAAAIAATSVAGRQTRSSGKIVSGLLGFLWIWTGVVYHLIFFTEINPAAYVFGAAFIVQGLLIFYQGILKKRLRFRIEPNLYGILGMIFVVYALVIYLFIGLAFGRFYPAVPSFGAPCPVVIFTFGLLMWTDKKLALHLLIIPFLWALIGTSAAFVFGMTEDFGLLLAAIVGTAFIIRRKFTPEREVYHEQEIFTQYICRIGCGRRHRRACRRIRFGGAPVASALGRD